MSMSVSKMLLWRLDVRLSDVLKPQELSLKCFQISSRLIHFPSARDSLIINTCHSNIQCYRVFLSKHRRNCSSKDSLSILSLGFISLRVKLSRGSSVTHVGILTLSLLKRFQFVRVLNSLRLLNKRPSLVPKQFAHTADCS